LQEGGGLDQAVAGGLVAGVPDRAGACGVTQAAEGVPGGELAQQRAVGIVADRGEPGAQPLLEQQQEPVGWREDAAGDEQVADMDDGPPRGQRAEPFVGERDLAAGERGQDRRDVRLADPQDPGAWPVHRADRVVEGDELWPDLAGSVIQEGGEPGGQDAVAAGVLAVPDAIARAVHQ
jgi:hypothetical protein